jgi:hypothetical protein
VYFAFGALAIVVASALRTLVAIPQLAGLLDTVTLSAFTIYGVLIFFYEYWGWRWLSTIKNLNGTWVGSISTHHGGTCIPCVMRLRQTWTRMAIELETKQSRSRTTMAALYDEQPGDVGLKYEYVSEPRSRAEQSMQIHRGICTLEITINSKEEYLSGDYFTGRGRETHGEITLHRISRELLGFDTALKKEKQ